MPHKEALEKPTLTVCLGQDPEETYPTVWPLIEGWLKENRLKGTYETIKETYEEVSKVGQWFLAFDGKRCVGVLSMQKTYMSWTDTNIALHHWLYVHPEYRGMGVSKRLLHLMEQWAKHVGCSEILMGVNLHGDKNPEHGKRRLIAEGYEFFGYQLRKKVV